MSKTNAGRLSSLCARCHSLDLAKYISPWTYDTLPIIARIAPRSIHNGCALCELFAEFVKTTKMEHSATNITQAEIARLHLLDGKSTADDAMVLMVHHHEEEDLETGQNWEMVSLSISIDTSYDRNFWLFPMQTPQAPSHGVMYGTGLKVDIDSADMEAARSWLDICKSHHGEESSRCTPVTLNLKIPLKVIDCQSRHVRPLQADESYICLSYVWGTATADNKIRNSNLPNQIPKTIEDAILVALQLGVPRIWVDQYCIDQENLEEKMSTIAAMDQIYGGAELTIIGASGDASSGLPGVNSTPRNPQRFIDFGHCSFVVVGDICHQMQASRWNSRGWTYQEGMLAPRRLVFTESQMYFQCAGMHCFESMNGTFHNPAVPSDRELKFFSGVGGGFSLNAVYDLIKEYFPRQLSFGSDSLHAFEGIMSKFQHTMTGDTHMKHFFGIPIFHNSRSKIQNSTARQFADGLMWRIAASCESPRSPTDNAHFPSWTWATRKAANPSATYRLLFEYTMRGVIHPSDINFRIKHRDGTEIDLVEFMTTFRSAPCTEFMPWLDLTTWTISSPISLTASDGGASIFQFLGLPTAIVHLDEYSIEEGDAVSLYMGVVHVQEEPLCSGALATSSEDRALPSFEAAEEEEIYRAIYLLVREVESHAYRRIGLLYAKLGSAPNNADEALVEMMKLKADNRDDLWERRLLRLV